MMSQPSTVSAVPSPIQQSGSQMTHSPISMMTSPSPQGYVVPSPASRNFSALSPSNTNLNTPAGTGQAPISQEDQAYLDKLNQLSKYIEPLRRINRRMMNRQSADKDEDRVREIHKMKNLLEILTDPSKRLPWKTLLKCEQVLLKLELEWDKTGELAPSNADVTVTKVTTTTTHMCQPLLDAVAAHMTSPMLNHSLQRTFGPAVSALHGSPIRAPSPPPKRRRVEEWDQDEIPHILQGEIARLGGRFKVNFDPTQHGGSKDIHLLCRLDDKNLPSIPPISVKVPGTYPNNSPECDTTAVEY
ncbi:mediator of RNA polymerase II transcription subunit 15-like, partial [Mizuhopecten yessoensis]|uniref:mediator of RNA polymerase II transcription subunit 15-like n=1 Tax=Mizuhopecten yessoensis TaxID=6573 RepID=UPI000B45A2E9